MSQKKTPDRDPDHSSDGFNVWDVDDNTTYQEFPDGKQFKVESIRSRDRVTDLNNETTTTGYWENF